jgi:hypothetical protein
LTLSIAGYEAFYHEMFEQYINFHFFLEFLLIFPSKVIYDEKFGTQEPIKEIFSYQ